VTYAFTLMQLLKLQILHLLPPFQVLYPPLPGLVNCSFVSKEQEGKIDAFQRHSHSLRVMSKPFYFQCLCMVLNDSVVTLESPSMVNFDKYCINQDVYHNYKRDITGNGNN